MGLRLPLQAQAAYRPGQPAQLPLHLRRHPLRPLLQTQRALVIYTRGQRYTGDPATPASLFNHQSAFIEFWLRFIGVQEVRTLTVENTWSPDKQEAAAAVEQGTLEAVRLAASF